MKSYSISHMSRLKHGRFAPSHCHRGEAVRKAILRFLATCPHPPSLREIGEAVGLSSSSTVWSHIRTLREEGRIAPAKLGQPRAILLADPGPSEVETLRADRDFWKFHEAEATARETQLRAQLDRMDAERIQVVEILSSAVGAHRRDLCPVELAQGAASGLERERGAVDDLRDRVAFWRGACEQNSEARCTEERFAHIQEITTLRARVEEAEELLRCERVLSARNGRRVDVLLRQLVELEAECERLRGASS
jgi:hypothetical protein